MIESKAQWHVKEEQDDESVIDLPISKITKELLMNRGIKDTNTAKRFLSPTLEDLHDPFLFSDMKKAIDRIEKAILDQEKILVFGDYDADGVTSTTVLIEALREKGAIVDFYIPNRFTEGYGPNEAAFRQAKEANISLIITVDTGIAAVHEANIAKELGVDLIITDHHEAQEEMPEAVAIIHPKVSSTYPFDELAGVGVAFKLAHALLGTFPQHLLELVSIGTIADLVPLQAENRVLVYYGLRSLTSSNRPGIKMLKEVCGIEGDVTEENIGFGIGPRLNAVGRLQDASLAVDLLLEQDIEVARELAEEVQRLNQERQKLVSEITKEAQGMIEENGFHEDGVLVVAKEDWNPGVLGIVASRLVQSYSKPTIVLGIDTDKQEAKGSARSIEAFNLFENCMEIKDRFISFGGHAQAAGMTVAVDEISPLRNNLSELANKKLSKTDFQPILTIDKQMNMREISVELIHEIEQLAPFGMGNPKPLFQLAEKDPKEIRLIGANQNHLKMNFQEDTKIIDAVGFGMGHLYTRISPHAKISIVGELSINEWNGHKKLQIMMKDLEILEWQLFDFRGTKHLQKQIQDLDTQNHVAIYFDSSTEIEDWMYKHLQVFHIDQWKETTSYDGSHLWFIDLPLSLDQVTEVLKELNPKNIFAYFKMNEENYFNQIPNREHFKWFYGIMMKRGSLDLDKERSALARSRGWSLNFLDFMIKVFLELQFVRIEDRELVYVKQPAKKDLTESATYQLKMNQIEVEKTLYYSTYKELKKWFNEQMTGDHLKEEVAHGL
ncbi:single-stranded-DNA-specific exonuclease [Salinibacillus kushneri]|uniref:Single-stranded-DNA-specific exonuclease RecJ n=1 Tax=Salinibacillus kushneri TaxID=237682 RepID=A0A1I0GAF0_9BACI|nr:single-stranded-DNA-specific exonuclease RecJ [Salinibacillus kushneri]SET66996.1 single-stranded-DNA-specific exonuclease [Salinibacillus kushneri]